jgi:hypothetical protein
MSEHQQLARSFLLVITTVSTVLSTNFTYGSENELVGNESHLQPSIVWLESADGVCDSVFDEPARPIDLIPTGYFNEIDMMPRGISVVISATISESGKLKNARVIKRSIEVANDQAIRALMECTFMPAYKGGKPVPSLVEVAYIFRTNTEENISESSGPSDNEIERRVGRILSSEMRAFFASADKFEVFEICHIGNANHQKRMTRCSTREISVRTSDTVYSDYFTIFEGVSLSAKEVERFKELVLKKSPFWVATHEKPSDNLDLRLGGFSPGYHYGVSIENNDEEVFLLINLARTGRIVVGSSEKSYGSGSPYRRSTDFWCELLESRLGRKCLGDEWLY